MLSEQVTSRPRLFKDNSTASSSRTDIGAAAAPSLIARLVASHAIKEIPELDLQRLGLVHFGAHTSPER